MERKIYFLGLTGKCKLSVEENRWVYYNDRGKNGKVLVECNTSDKSMRLCIKKVDADKFVRIDEDEIEKGVKKVLNEDGSRWEGDWYNEKPFGFGKEYFADNHNVDYCGNFMNDLRHGWGTTYDRNGQKLYEGDWRCGKNDFEEKMVIEDNSEKEIPIHDLVKDLVIGENCFNSWRGDMVIEKFPNLQSIVVKKSSFQNIGSLRICNCNKLKNIHIEDGKSNKGSFSYTHCLRIESICFFFLIIISS